MAVKNWRRFAPFYFYTTVAFCLWTAAAVTEARSTTSILLLLVLGFLSWGLVEYGLHRLIFHYDARSELSRRLVYQLHLSHHEQPRSVDKLFARLSMSVPIAVGYCLLTWALVRSWQMMAYLFTGLLAGYFSYEWLHYQAHHGRPRRRLFRYLKNYHLLHHHQTPDLRFGVTSPFLDYLFGTYRSPSGRSRRAEEHMS